MDRMVMSELIKQDGRIVGAVGFNTNSGDLYIIESKATVIAAGSSSLKLVAKPTHYWTSDGEAMAYRAGAEITGKEFKFGGGRMPLRSGVEVAMKMAPQYRKPEGDWQEQAIETLTRFPAFRAGLMGPSTTTTINAEGGQVFSSSWEAHCGRAPVYIDLDAFSPEMKEWARSWFRRQGTAETDKIDLDLYNGGKLQFSAGRVEAIQSNHGGSGIWPVDTKCSTAIPGLYAAGNSCATLVSGASYAGMGIGLCHASVTGNRAGLAAVEAAMASEKIKPEKAEVSRIKEMVCAPIDRKGGFSSKWLI
jgi:succinate dehydrogenase/fumarate reductase flavoprotein subunit